MEEQHWMIRYMFALKKIKEFIDVKIGGSIIVLSLLEGLSILIGYNHRNYSVYNPIHSTDDIFRLCCLIIFLSFLNLSIDFVFCSLIDKRNSKFSELLFFNEKRLFWILFGTLILFWMPYFVLSYPGGAWYDTGNQICQIMGAEVLTKANPLLQTLLSGGFFLVGTKLGNPEFGIALYIIIQMITSALVLSYSIISLCRIFKSKWIPILMVISYAIIPVVPLYIITIGKDTNFGIQIVLALTCITNIYQNGMINKIDKVLYPVSIILMSLFRNAGIYLAVLFVIVSVAVASKRRKLSAVLGVGAIVFVLIFQIVSTSAFQIDMKVNETENLSIPLLQMGGYLNEYYDELTEDELHIIDRVISIDKVRREYDVEISDSIKVAYMERNPSQSDLDRFYRLYSRFLYYRGYYLEGL